MVCFCLGGSNLKTCTSDGQAEFVHVDLVNKIKVMNLYPEWHVPGRYWSTVWSGCLVVDLPVLQEFIWMLNTDITYVLSKRHLIIKYFLGSISTLLCTWTFDIHVTHRLWPCMFGKELYVKPGVILINSLANMTGNPFYGACWQTDLYHLHLT